ncbi:GNAT family N-acetyltransferase [uncultured Phenylobacterium sp.]|uniref:GNAT family N-acetyltransferase n=1 Tax=uncultured Phenylobacterium sp. TaxID=349273 RepID=UPI0025DD171B|nr:GNAT family N-acetyltransferase [uncultured Phenylobacterium sp.]
MIIRAAEPGDAAALAAIYGHAVLEGFGTFEETPPSPAEMEARRAAVAARGLPYLVAEADGQVLGFAYAAPFRTREAYRFTLEDSVYVAPDAVGRGVGRAVLRAVVAACEALGVRQLVAVIGDSGNAASIGLHRSLGFAPAGVGRSFGFKHGRWVDVVWMQKSINGGDEHPPDGPGVDLSGT